ncbi:MAG: class I SAM-dependent methyltransferase [Bacteroidales bacterium]|jgi:tRNA (cmo5U34)-methyltransferase|nr:class I SAM-dependent methyltransferase [Bacteroidales bacterium]
MSRIESIKNHFEAEAREFDATILKLIPHYEEMIAALVAALPFGKNEAFSVIDLGCGTGTLAQKVKRAFPNARITCVDIAENMIAIAKLKIGDDNRFIVSDFYNFDFPERYDAIISSLALHHLANDDDKQMFYRKIYNALAERGVFYNADVVLASTPYMQDLYMAKWREFMAKSVSPEEMERKWIASYHAEDRPASLENHLKCLREIGFANIDVVWKYYNFCVYGGGVGKQKECSKELQ